MFEDNKNINKYNENVYKEKKNLRKTNIKKIKSKFIINILAILVLLLTGSFFTSNIFALSKYGSRGAEVRKIQDKLRRWGYYKGNIDGIYGSGTVSAVKYFQRKNGLTPDGIAGKRTLEKMGIFNSSGNSNSSNSTSNGDLNLLAKAVYSEARGEPYNGQVAIAAVILNRVKSSSFPNTISGVVYQKGAFTAVSDGQINLRPNQTAYNAARDALNGWDPSYGAIYYFNPKTATNKWIWSRPHIITIGNHRFCK